MKALQTKAGFKLYIYIAKNQPDYNFNLSSADFCQCTGFSRTAYNSAVKELIEKEFLIDCGNNQYIFVDNPFNENLLEN